MTQVTRLFDFLIIKQIYFNSDALNTKQNGVWIKTSTQEYIESFTISRAYCEWNQNDKIAVISSSNRTEWNIMDIGILQTERKTYPYTLQSPKMIMNIY
jgi:long-chain acyl-CoA synthetase